MDNLEFTNLFKENLHSIYRFSYFRLNNKEEAEDITSETFSKAYASWEKTSIEYPKAWLFKICRNLIYEKYRKNQPVTENEEELENFSEETSLEDQVLKEELLRVLKEEINKLDDVTKEIIALKVWETMQFNEIAVVLSEPESTVKTKFYRGIQKLKLDVQSDYPVQLKSVTAPSLLFAISAWGSSNEFDFPKKLLSLTNQFIANSHNLSNLADKGSTAAVVATGGVLSAGILKAAVFTISAGVLISGAIGATVLVPKIFKDQPIKIAEETVSCTYYGVSYAVGEEFNYGDGCNTCICGDNRNVTCGNLTCEEDNSGDGQYSASFEFRNADKFTKIEQKNFFYDQCMPQNEVENFIINSTIYSHTSEQETYHAALIKNPEVNLNKNTIYDQDYYILNDIFKGTLNVERIRNYSTLFYGLPCDGSHIIPLYSFEKIVYENIHEAKLLITYGSVQSTVDKGGFFPVYFTVFAKTSNEYMLLNISTGNIYPYLKQNTFTQCETTSEYGNKYIDVYNGDSAECVKRVLDEQLDKEKVMNKVNEVLKLYEVKK